ncbi:MULTISPECIES: ABC transporter substrate-binding protein [Microbacterium]|uniref:NitT/TauT family transport system substrate-binding protein n=1 Tax=Microbacterium saccharophilum TaxID=1213358 RepID=A0A7Z7CYE6_9MICO|nr:MULTISPECIES: ABC transporter substrate-binding protein [Microbacterium]SFI18077.1 NitT/TauT family transport system substrate-binding protein [Microbacterium saccharophilum]
MRRARTLTGVAVTLAAAAVLSGCAGDTSTDDAAGEEVYQVRVTQAFQSLYYLSLYVAQEKGFLEDEGIELVGGLGNAGSGGAALATVLQGESQIALGGPENVAFINAEGGDTVAFSAAANSAPNWMVAAEGVTFDSPADLAGHSITVATCCVTANTLLKELLQSNDLEWGVDVTINEVQQGSEVGPALTGSTDFAVAGEPLISQAVQQGLEIVYDWTEQYPDFAYSSFMTTREILESEPDMIQAFTNAINSALEYIHSDPDGAIEVATDAFPELDEEVVAAAVARMIESNVYPPSALITESAITSALERQTYVGNLAELPAYETVIDPSFAETALGN